MRNKAIELKKLSNSRGVKQNTMKVKRATKEREEQGDDDSEEGSYFPEDVWRQMSPANKKYIIKLKKEKKVTFGSQYGKRGDNDKDKSRNANNVKTVSKIEDDDNKKEEVEDISKYQIWKPAINVRKQNLMKTVKI